jgi:hypothetical protein
MKCLQIQLLGFACVWYIFLCKWLGNIRDRDRDRDQRRDSSTMWDDSPAVTRFVDLGNIVEDESAPGRRAGVHKTQSAILTVHTLIMMLTNINTNSSCRQSAFPRLETQTC